MRKQLPTDDIANELAGSSVFFQPAPAEQRQGQAASKPCADPADLFRCGRRDIWLGTL